MFNVGDEIVVVDGSLYMLTKSGSVGTITHIVGGLIRADFAFVANRPPRNYVVHEKDCELVKKSDSSSVIRKIRQMENRWRGAYHV